MTWDGKDFKFVVKNRIKIGSDEIKVIKKWLDEEDNIVEGTKNVTVQLRRNKITSHNVNLTIKRDSYSTGGWWSTNYPEVTIMESGTFSGNQLTITYPDRINGAGSTISVTAKKHGTNQSVTVNRSSSNGNIRLQITNVPFDVDVMVEYQRDTTNLTPALQNTIKNGITFTGNGSGTGNGPDTTFPTGADIEKATKTLKATENYMGSWTFGSDGDFPLSDTDGSYLYYVVELDKAGNPLDEGDSLIRIDNNEGITTGVITVYNRSDNKTAEITINKVDTDNNPLAGAWFSLTKDSERLTNLTTDPEVELNEDEWFQINGDEACLKISELEDGEYSLKEEQAPDGYIITTQPLTFIVENGEVTNRSDDVDEDTDIITIVNEPGVSLPNTGGPGTRLYTIFGSLLFAFSGILLIRRQISID